MTKKRKAAWKLSIVSPVYNESNSLPVLVQELSSLLEEIAPPGGYEIILVNDGSTDGSESIMNQLARESGGRVIALHLTRNFGLEPAVSAGLEYSSGDAVVILDADLQDDPAALFPFVEEWEKGYDVVYAVRSSRQESRLRRLLFWGFYRLSSWLANIDLPLDAGNFALMDRRVVDELLALPERNRYLRGLRAWVGFPQTGVPIARRTRHHGKTNIGFRGQWKLAMNAIFAFSYMPLFLFRLAGFFSLLLCVVLIGWALYAKLCTGLEIQAWASQFITTSFFGGINLLGIGVIGEYVARIHDEVKGRPNYIVREVVQGEDISD